LCVKCPLRECIRGDTTNSSMVLIFRGSLHCVQQSSAVVIKQVLRLSRLTRFFSPFGAIAPM
jgi:hypothetical protein